MTTPTPAQAKKEADQLAWDQNVERKLDQLTEHFPSEDDHASTAAFYRQLYALRVDIEQTTKPGIASKYNKAIQTLFMSYDALPAALFIDDTTPRP